MKREERVALCKAIEEAYREITGTYADPGFVIMLSVPPEYNEAHYASNLERDDALLLLRKTIGHLVTPQN